MEYMGIAFADAYNPLSAALRLPPKIARLPRRTNFWPWLVGDECAVLIVGFADRVMGRAVYSAAK